MQCPCKPATCLSLSVRHVVSCLSPAPMNLADMHAKPNILTGEGGCHTCAAECCRRTSSSEALVVFLAGLDGCTSGAAGTLRDSSMLLSGFSPVAGGPWPTRLNPLSPVESPSSSATCSLACTSRAQPHIPCMPQTASNFDCKQRISFQPQCDTHRPRSGWETTGVRWSGTSSGLLVLTVYLMCEKYLMRASVGEHEPQDADNGYEATNTATTTKQALGQFLTACACADACLVLKDAGVERLEGVHQQVLHQQVDLFVYVLPLRSHLPRHHTPCSWLSHSPPHRCTPLSTAGTSLSALEPVIATGFPLALVFCGTNLCTSAAAQIWANSRT